MTKPLADHASNFGSITRFLFPNRDNLVAPRGGFQFLVICVIRVQIQPNLEHSSPIDTELYLAQWRITVKIHNISRLAKLLLLPVEMESSLRWLHNRSLILRQPVQLVHQRVNLRVGALDHESSESLRKARNPFAPFASFRVIRDPNIPPQSPSPPPSTHTPARQSAADRAPLCARSRYSMRLAHSFLVLDDLHCDCIY